MSQFNADPLGSWATSSSPPNLVDYDIAITDAFDLLIPPAVTQDQSNAASRSASFPSIGTQMQAPLTGRLLLEASASAQPETHPTALSAHSSESDDGLASPAEQKSKRTGTSRYTTELKLAKNREAQRRFRLKQKAKSSNIQAQLANTAAQVQALEQQKNELEASNVLLRQSSNFQQGGQAQAAQAEAAFSGPSPWNAAASSFPGRKQDVPQAQLAAAWTDHIHQMGTCLLQIDGNEDPSVHTALQRLTSEAMTLVAQLVRTHGKVSGPVMHNAKTPGFDEHMHPQPNEAFYARILTNMQLSEDQAKDLLFLRRLFLTRRCVLSMDRKALISQLAASDTEVLNPTENITTVEHLTATLKENAAEDHELYYKVARAMFRGVLDTRQVAQMMVHAYPYVNVHEALLESLALACQEFSKDDIVAAAKTDRMAADYAQLLQYCDNVGKNVYSGHLPIWTCCPGARPRRG